MTSTTPDVKLTRDQRRSLMLGRAVAEALKADPERALTIARTNLMQMHTVHTRGQAKRWLDEWSALIEGPLPPIMEVLTSTSQHACELRQNSPFAGVLHQHQRLEVLAAFRAAEAANVSLV